MSRLQSVKDYRSEIAELDSRIALEERFNQELGADAASEMSLRALRNRRDELVTEMDRLGDDAMPLQEIAVVFDGRPVTDHRVDATFLGTMLHGLQRVVHDMTASATGVRTRRGGHRRRVKQASTLQFAGSFEGSFGMVLESEVTELPVQDIGSVAYTIESLLQLLLAGDDESALLEQISHLDERARASYMDLLQQLAKNKADMKLHWRSVGGEREARITPRVATRVLEKLNHQEVKEWLQSYEGVLDGGMTTKAVFAFIPEAGDRMEGVVAPNVLEHFPEFHFGQRCRARISTRQVTDLTTGNRRLYHKLEELTTLEGES